MYALKIFNSDVIPVYETDNGNKVVIGRELHYKLGLKSRYNDWFTNMCKYGFEEGKDFFVLPTKIDSGKRGRPRKEQVLSLDMAKHIAMLQKSEKGFVIRQRLIDLEKESLLCGTFGFEIPKTFSEALRLAADLEEEVQGLKVKADYADHVLKSDDGIRASEIAKEFGMSPQKLNHILENLNIIVKINGRWVLRNDLLGQGLMTSETRFYDTIQGRKVFCKIHSLWTQKGRKFIHDTLKDIGITPSQQNREVELYYTARELGEKLGKSATFVNKALEKNGLMVKKGYLYYATPKGKNYARPSRLNEKGLFTRNVPYWKKDVCDIIRKNSVTDLV